MTDIKSSYSGFDIDIENGDIVIDQTPRPSVVNLLNTIVGTWFWNLSVGTDYDSFAIKKKPNLGMHDRYIKNLIEEIDGVISATVRSTVSSEHRAMNTRVEVKYLVSDIENQDSLDKDVGSFTYHGSMPLRGPHGRL